MSYFLPNLGRRYTTDYTIECLASATGLVLGTTNYRVRENTGSWTQPKAFEPRFLFTMSSLNGTGNRTIELELDDGTNPAVNLTQTVTVVDEADPYVSWYPETQRVANNLPQWHPGRRLRSSNWQKFVNPMGGSVQRLSDRSTHANDSKYLVTAPVDEIDVVTRIYPDQTKLLTNKSDLKNLITNPTLTLFHQPFGEPDDWALNGAWDVDSTVSLFGYNSLQCSPAVSERATAVQSIPLNLRSGESVTAALYYRTPISGSTTPPATVDFALQAVILYEDGTSEVSSATLLPETNGRWERTELTATASAHATRVYIIVNIDGISGISPFNFNVGGVSLNRGSRAGSFSYGQTWPHYLKGRANPDLEPSSELWLTTSREEFGISAIPTRIDTPGSSQASGSFTADAIPVRAYTIYDAVPNIHDVGYLAASNKIGFYKIQGGTEDLIKSYDVAFYDQGMSGYVAVDGFEVEAVTWFRGRLWAVGQFTDQTAANNVQIATDWGTVGAPVQSGDRVKYLLLMNHLTPREEVDYMEVIMAYPLAVFASSTPIVKIEFQNNDPQWIHYWTASDYYYSRLYYDYGLVNIDGSVWFREPQSEISLA